LFENSGKPKKKLDLRSLVKKFTKSLAGAQAHT